VQCAVEPTSGCCVLSFGLQEPETSRCEIPSLVKLAKMRSPSLYTALMFLAFTIEEISAQAPKEQLGKMPVCAVRRTIESTVISSHIDIYDSKHV
jgi:hypothetical protein